VLLSPSTMVCFIQNTYKLEIIHDQYRSCLASGKFLKKTDFYFEFLETSF
jgi:hypothetical protein